MEDPKIHPQIHLPELALRDGPVRDELELLVGEVVALQDVDRLHLVLLPRRQAQVRPALRRRLLPLQRTLTGDGLVVEPEPEPHDAHVELVDAGHVVEDLAPEDPQQPELLSGHGGYERKTGWGK